MRFTVKSEITIDLDEPLSRRRADDVRYALDIIVEQQVREALVGRFNGAREFDDYEGGTMRPECVEVDVVESVLDQDDEEAIRAIERLETEDELPEAVRLGMLAPLAATQYSIARTCGRRREVG